jgi:hypothetical protein
LEAVVEAYRRAVARSSQRLWPLEDRVQPVRPLGKQGYLAASIRNTSSRP